MTATPYSDKDIKISDKDIRNYIFIEIYSLIIRTTRLV